MRFVALLAKSASPFPAIVSAGPPVAMLMDMATSAVRLCSVAVDRRRQRRGGVRPVLRELEGHHPRGDQEQGGNGQGHDGPEPSTRTRRDRGRGPPTLPVMVRGTERKVASLPGTRSIGSPMSASESPRTRSKSFAIRSSSPGHAAAGARCCHTVVALRVSGRRDRRQKAQPCPRRPSRASYRLDPGGRLSAVPSDRRVTPALLESTDHELSRHCATQPAGAGRTTAGCAGR